MKIKDFVNDVQKIIPLKQAEDFDNVGLLCGNPEYEISGILVCHDALVGEVYACCELALFFRKRRDGGGHAFKRVMIYHYGDFCEGSLGIRLEGQFLDYFPIYCRSVVEVAISV